MPCFWLNRGVSRSNWFLYRSMNQLMWFILQTYQTVIICNITCKSTCNLRVIDSFTTILSTISKCLGTHRTSRINGKYLLHYLDWFLIRNDIQALWCSLQLQPRSPFNKCHNILKSTAHVFYLLQYYYYNLSKKCKRYANAELNFSSLIFLKKIDHTV